MRRRKEQQQKLHVKELLRTTPLVVCVDLFVVETLRSLLQFMLQFIPRTSRVERMEMVEAH